jgi:N-acetylmuramoyl-L-alanine amidase
MRPAATSEVADARALILIDAGHGGLDGGTQGFGVLEKDVALDTARRLERELRKRGLRTLLTREADTSLALADRAEIVNRHRPAALVSVHYNFTTDSADVRGLEVFYSSPKAPEATSVFAARAGRGAGAVDLDAATLALGSALREAACARARTPDRGTRNRPNLAITRHSACPAVLVECGYLSNPLDAQRAKSAAWRADMAAGLADGVVNWLTRQQAFAGR